VVAHDAFPPVAQPADPRGHVQPQSGLLPTSHSVSATKCKRSTHRRMLVEPSPPPTSGALHAQKRVGWQPSRFRADRAEAERAFALAERLGNFNAAAATLGTPGRGYAKPSPATAWACPPATPRRSDGGRSGPPASAPASQSLHPGPGVPGPQSPAPSWPEIGLRPSCLSGSAGMRRTPSWVPTWSSCTAKATLAGRLPRAWAVIRRAECSYRLDSQCASRRYPDRIDCASRPQQPQEREEVADPR
jgi:hypothetical protein